MNIINVDDGLSILPINQYTELIKLRNVMEEYFTERLKEKETWEAARDMQNYLLLRGIMVGFNPQLAKWEVK